MPAPQFRKSRTSPKVDDHVCRGAQPTDEGFNYLAKIGVKTVVDLREHDERALAEEHVVAAAGMQYVNVPMTGLTPPTEAEITKILALLEDYTTVQCSCTASAERTALAPLSLPTASITITGTMLEL